MAVKFYLLQIKNLQRENVDTITITFDIPENLSEIFKYKHGQYITVKVPVNGEENRRAYSICSSPVETKDIQITVKKVDEGKVSRYLNDNLKIGDYFEVMPPLGNFTIELNDGNTGNYIMIGGGSGITPLISIIKTILLVEKNSKITLIYQNRNEDSIIFKSELESLINKYSDRFNIINILSKPSSNWTGLTGRLNTSTISAFIKDISQEKLFRTEFFICGPTGLMHESEAALKQLMIASYRIHKESFTIAIPNSDNENNIVFDENVELKTRKVKIILYGDELEYTVEPDETILTAAQREGYDPPFSCQIGACSTCRAKLKSGKVSMDERDSLTDDEIEDGYVLTCQSHPLTDDVIIDYDDN